MSTWNINSGLCNKINSFLYAQRISRPVITFRVEDFVVKRGSWVIWGVQGGRLWCRSDNDSGERKSEKQFSGKIRWTTRLPLLVVRFLLASKFNSPLPISPLHKTLPIKKVKVMQVQNIKYCPAQRTGPQGSPSTVPAKSGLINRDYVSTDFRIFTGL